LNSNMKNLIISDGLPSEENAGPILLNQIYNSLSVCNKTIIYSTRANGEDSEDYYSKNLRPFRENKLIYKFTSFIPLFFELFMVIRLFQINDFLKKKIKDKQYKCLVILRGDAIFITYLLNLIGIKYSIYIPDGIEAENDDKYLVNKFKTKFYYIALKNSIAIGVTNSLAKKKIQDIVQNKSFYILRPFFNKFNFSKNKKIKIVFSGSLYASESLIAFAESLNLFNDLIDFEFITISKKNILINTNLNYSHKHYEWMNQNELNTILKTCDIGYLPYSFSAKKKDNMIMGFPGKLGLYCSHNLKIFAHCPKYSSLHNEINNSPIGLSCSSLDHQVIKSSFLQIVEMQINESDYNKFYSENLSKEYFVKNLFKLI
ncbi:hypothetical protein N9L21_00975, partial [Flavobacteriaceae bacterium]|nr:hypothetical protein [Flavobacteriaceae bacterium]